MKKFTFNEMKEMSPLKFLILLLASTVALFLGIAIYVLWVTSSNMPSLAQLENPKQNIATRIYTADNELLDMYFIERRVPLKYNDIPKDFVNALISTEDRKFWRHWGIHVGRVFNSMVKNVFTSRREGASTITMQLARNLYLNFDQTMERKIREAVTAVQIEKTYTKEEILELYTNTVNFGRGAYGLAVAAKVYFNKEPNELTTAECAYLVGCLKKPEYYNRKENYDDAVERRNLVLKLMYDEGYLNSAQYLRAIEEPLEFATSKTSPTILGGSSRLGIAPHFVEMLRQELTNHPRLKEYDLYRDGLTIYTTIDSRIQKLLNQALEEYMPEIQNSFNANWSWKGRNDILQKLLKRAITMRTDYRAAKDDQKKAIMTRLLNDQRFIDSVKNAVTTVQVGVVIMNPATGAVLAMAGASPKFMRENPDAKYSLNHAYQIRRQPGSAFKPFVYASSLIKGLTPDSRVACGPYSYTLSSGEVWSPRGSGCNDGETTVSLTTGLARSINTVAARLITQVTSPRDVIDLANKMGITSPLAAVPALSLGGGGEVSPYEMTSAFCTFANNGWHISPYFFESIETNNGEVLLTAKNNRNITDVFDKEIAQQMTYMMMQVINAGTASRVRQFLKDVDAAGKTGTTNNSTDAWFIGYTPQLVCGIWMGFDYNEINFDCLGSVGYGGRTAAPLWGKIMSLIYSDPQIPYKQKKFIFNPVDSLAQQVSWKPYNLTNTQKNAGEVNIFDDNSIPSNGGEPHKSRDDGPILAPLPRDEE
ncbi:MAG TPA: PBP1A family penicillin-binding protein [Candidatus Kapabacteria bacterium]|nr:PBP1A family penicillin-binding protein [Candidatus Kapabacteria bacterium]